MTKKTAASKTGTAHTQTQSQTELTLAREVKELTKEVQKLKDLEFMKVFKHPLKFLGYSFLKGVMVGFGSVLGASVVVAIFVYLLAQISVVPFIGDMVEDIMQQINMSTTEEGKTINN